MDDDVQANELRARTPRERDFEEVCLQLLNEGRVPTPRVLEWWGFGNGRTIRGNYVKIRRRLLRLAGYTGGGAPGNRWVKA